MVLGPVVCSVGGSSAPEKMELVLGFATSKPMESHIHGFCALGLYVVVHNSKGCTVVGLHESWGWGLMWPISASVWHCGTALCALM